MTKLETYLAERHAEMTAADVLTMLDLFEAEGIALHVDGGWAVDALIGKQTRPHQDLDIAIEHKDVARLRALLDLQGYQELWVNDSWACNFVLADDAGHLLDVHSYSFDAQGKHIFGCAYPVEALTGTGVIGGKQVACISPEWLIKFHTGYDLDENDFLDVSNLCRTFGITLPTEYDKFLT